jgi:hypothetical protein
MTYAPRSYKDAQSYLCARTGLSAVSVGLVGDAAHGTSGYHLGWDRVRLGRGLQDYSYRESSRDRAVVSDASSAIDVGWFSVRVGARTVTLLDFNAWLVGQCRAGAADTLWIREVIYTPDRKTVKRWDRLGVRTAGDSSHLTHTHISGFRDAENIPKRPLFERFFAAMANAESTAQGVDMPLTPQDLVALWTHDLMDGPNVEPAYKTLLRAADGVTALKADVAAIKAKPVADPVAVAAALAADPGFVAGLASAIAAQVNQGAGATAAQVRQIVDEELDEQSRGGADNDPA